MKHSLLTTLLLSLLFSCGIPSSLQANELININGIYYDCNGKYYIEKDEKGVYLRTDKDLSWYLDGDDLDVFKTGGSGFYYLETDTKKPYILTDKKRVFYINQEVAENLKKEIGNSNKFDEPIENIKGFDKFYVNGRYNDHYITPQEARKRIKGQPTLEWERKKRAEEMARIKAELEAIEKRRTLAEEEALWESGWARQEAEEARQKARREAEWARQEAEEQTRRSYTYDPPPQYRSSGAINPYTGEFYPSTGDGGLIRPSDGTYFAPAGPGGVVNSRTGEFVPTGP